MKIAQATLAVKEFISARWTDRKIAEVEAFCRDGKMNDMNPCCCLIGVTSSDNLHQSCGTAHNHYFEMLKMDQAAKAAECAYMKLNCCDEDLEGLSPMNPDAWKQSLTDARLLGILHEIRMERAASHATEAETALEKELVYADR